MERFIAEATAALTYMHSQVVYRELGNATDQAYLTACQPFPAKCVEKKSRSFFSVCGCREAVLDPAKSDLNNWLQKYMKSNVLRN